MWFCLGVLHMGTNAGGIIHTSPLCVKTQVQNNQRTAQFPLTLQINRYSWAFNTTTPPFSRQRRETISAQLLIHSLYISCPWWMNVLVILHAPLSHQRSCQYRWLPPAGDFSIRHFYLSFFVVLLLSSSLLWQIWSHCALCTGQVVSASSWDKVSVCLTPNWLHLMWQQ